MIVQHILHQLCLPHACITFSLTDNSSSHIVFFPFFPLLGQSHMSSIHNNPPILLECLHSDSLFTYYIHVHICLLPLISDLLTLHCMYFHSCLLTLCFHFVVSNILVVQLEAETDLSQYG